MSNKTIWHIIDSIPRQFYYTILLFLLCYALVFPMGLPIRIKGETKELYNLIEGLPEDSVVLVDIAFGAGGMPELGPPYLAVMHHLFSRPLRVIVMTLYTEGPQMYSIYLDKLNPEETYGKKYGEDYVFFGYNAGGVTTMTELAKDMRFLGTDYMGTPLDQLPVMEGVYDNKDVALVITFSTASGGISSPTDWVQQWATPYGATLACVVLKMMMPTVSPYYGAGQVKALIPGAGAAAEYELLIDKPGEGLASTDALSLAHLLVISLMVLGNIGYFKLRGERK